MISNLPTPSLDKGSLALTEEYVRLRAYQLFELRGCEHGHDVEDWLHAEAEIMGFHEVAAVEEVRIMRAVRR
ncbi:DUF2934 domain-containing protein [Candidatus Korobacter versatilis]|uniref:DUF2934 domain-containing protein n=1 Tax=Candidatus Korobacter versatilis TaxID=658062 RepID=UPI000308FB41|nr:DUF2934 domain-containing protein [Candidatus Koribacter versatilis]